ncbi:hypothetical protein F5887DRAFT_291957 [Amanita rubescens]|nr:hypothetical protein F5887DRAFT_291957 [Amanita rubescens]
MKFTAFGSIIALALVGVAAAAGVPAQNPNSGKTPTQSPNTGTTTPNTSQDQCVQSACTCSGSPGNFCGSAGSPNNCLVGHLYACQQGGTACDLGLNDSCKN